MINLDHLNVITTIIDTGSFQLASEKLNKARSAVSYSVKQMEEHLQVQIFDRSNYRPSLTPEGQAMLPEIRQLLKHARGFEGFVQDLRGENETELRLGVSSIFPVARLSGLLQSLRSQFPATTLHLEFEVASGERLLLSEQVDLAIFAAPVRNMALEYRQIASMEVPLVIAKDVIPCDPQAVTREDLAQHPQVVVKSTDEKSPDTGLLEDAPKWFVTELGAKKDLICAGLGWGRLPSHMIAEEIAQGDLMVLPTLGDITLPICISKRSHQDLGPVGAHIWKFFDPPTA